MNYMHAGKLAEEEPEDWEHTHEIEVPGEVKITLQYSEGKNYNPQTTLNDMLKVFDQHVPETL